MFSSQLCFIFFLFRVLIWRCETPSHDFNPRLGNKCQSRPCTNTEINYQKQKRCIWTKVNGNVILIKPILLNYHWLEQPRSAHTVWLALSRSNVFLCCLVRIDLVMLTKPVHLWSVEYTSHTLYIKQYSKIIRNKTRSFLLKCLPNVKRLVQPCSMLPTFLTYFGCL